MKLSRNFTIYLASSIVSGALPLALMPLLTHRLQPAEYGTMVAIVTMIALVGPLVTWATTAYLSVQYFKVDQGEVPGLLSTLLVIPLVTTGLLTLLFTIGDSFLANRLDLPYGWRTAIPLMAAMLLMPQVVQVILSVRGQAVRYAGVEITGAVLTFGATAFLVLDMGLSWRGRIIAQAGAGALLSIAAIGWLMQQGLLRRRFDRTEFAGALRFGTGTVAHDLASQALRLSDRLLITAMLGHAAVGAYAVAVQWSSIMLTILAAFNRAWVPYLFSTLATAAPGWAGKLVRQTYLIWGALLLLLICFDLATPVGYAVLIDRRYHASMPAAFWLTLGYFFNGIYLTVVDYIFYLKKPHILAAITVTNLVLNIGLSYLLIGVFGPVGAAMAFAIVAFVVMLLTAATVQILYPMPWLGGRKG